MTAHEVVIRFGRPFDVDADKRSDLLDSSSSRIRQGRFLADIQEIRIPFGDRESAEAAQREITVHVRPVHDAGGEDYRPVVPGEVVREVAEIKEGKVGVMADKMPDWLARQLLDSIPDGPVKVRLHTGPPSGTGAFEADLRAAAATEDLSEALAGLHRIATAAGVFEETWQADSIGGVCDMLAAWCREHRGGGADG